MLARYCGAPEMQVEMATDPIYGHGKQRMVILVSSYTFEKIIASTGGQSCKVRNPPGHAQISEERATEIKFFVHKTDSKSIDSIYRTGSLMNIKREGVHLTIQTSGSYRRRATQEVQFDILKAIKNGYIFSLKQI